MKSHKKWCLGVIVLAATTAASADTVIPMYKSTGKPVGTITATDTDKGLMLTPNLTNISPGRHGFHVHENASCSEGGKAAGSHFDPDKTEKHSGPEGAGHQGDLPFLTADENGKVTEPVVIARLKEADLKGHSLIIHAGGDNYSDEPEKLGGGGERIACGVVE